MLVMLDTAFVGALDFNSVFRPNATDDLDRVSR